MPITAASDADFDAMFDQLRTAVEQQNAPGLDEGEWRWQIDAAHVLAARLFASPAQTARGLATKVRVLALLVGDAPIDQDPATGAGPLWHTLMADANAIDAEAAA